MVSVGNWFALQTAACGLGAATRCRGRCCRSGAPWIMRGVERQRAVRVGAVAWPGCGAADHVWR